MRRLALLALLATCLVLAALLVAKGASTPGALERRSGEEAADDLREARLAGRTGSGTDLVSHRATGGRARPVEASIRCRVVGPEERPLTIADRRRLLAREAPIPASASALESALLEAEADLVRELAAPAGVLLAGTERGEGPDVAEKPWIDADTGEFTVSLREPFDVEALAVYGGRVVARSRLAAPATELVVDPELAFAATGTLELLFVRADTGQAVADVAVEIAAVDRDAAARARIGERAGTAPVRPLRLERLPVGRYHVHADDHDIPRRLGAATVEVAAGTVTRTTVSLTRARRFTMRWFGPDGKPRSSRYTSLALRDAADRLHEVPVSRSREDPDVFEVRLVPPGPCWLVTPDHRAHRVEGTARGDGPPFEMHLQEAADVILVVHVDELSPHALATRAPTRWTIRDANGVTVATDTLPLTSVDTDGSFRAWTHLTPGRYRVRWILGPDRAVERDVVVPPNDEWVVLDLDG